MVDFNDHINYNCEITTDQGQTYRVYANWIHNNDLDHWRDWQCFTGAQRVYIDKDLQVYNGECRNTRIGSALDAIQLPGHVTCNRDTCTGCTDDLMATKHCNDQQ